MLGHDTGSGWWVPGSGVPVVRGRVGARGMGPGTSLHSEGPILRPKHHFSVQKTTVSLVSGMVTN